MSGPRPGRLLAGGRDAVPGPAPEVAPGEPLLPGYRAVQRLAHGRRLDTWDAYDEERGCRCVVKVVRADRRHEREVVDGVLREGRIVTTLTHPHLVRGYAVLTDPRAAVVLETLRGATLAAVVEEGALGVEDTALLGLQLVSVLGYLHRHDWLHLDLKPGNVVVEHGKAVLLDLSLAARPGAGRPGAGTPGYLAPEQVAGEGLTPATDVWGLGVLLREALSGEEPTPPARWRARRPAPVRVASHAPAELATLLAACGDPDPAGRPRLVDVRAVLAAYADDGTRLP
ncbi:serine/threonine-protein kinase [Nocardioides kribbensis]|uniref:serine/threonine-protein kinase n=1 Tax=Nocardioides kribbensis TaxID=305517 RepID=UPI0032DA6F2B